MRMRGNSPGTHHPEKDIHSLARDLVNKGCFAYSQMNAKLFIMCFFFSLVNWVNYENHPKCLQPTRDLIS